MIKNEQFYHLHVHDQYSLLDGFGTAQQYCKYAKELGFPGLALTNHGNVDGVLRWQESCKEHGLQGIYGCEAYIVPNRKVKKKGEKRFHICLFAKNMTGLHNIMRMLNAANLDGFYYRARIDPELLMDNLDGVAIGTACIVSFINMPGGMELLQQLSARTEVFVEIMPHLMPEQKAFNQRCVGMAARYGLPLIVTNDCHYVKPGQSELQEVLLAIQGKKKWNDKNRFKFSIDTLWLMTVDEMHATFKEQGAISSSVVEEGMYNTALLAKVCNFKIKQQPVRLPKPHVKGYNHIENEDMQLVQLAYDGYLKRKEMHNWIKPSNETIYTTRLEEELELICHLGFARYFLIVYELINWCRSNDIMTGPGRGSVGGSLVAFCMFLTSVDPIKYHLVFSRFISEGRIDLPDIDMDFEDIKRGKILEHLKELYGEYNVVGLSTFSVMRGRGALRDISRVFDVPLVDVNKAASCIVVRSLGDMRVDFGIADAFDAFEDGIVFKKKYPTVSRIAMAMEGQIRASGTHAAAMCVSNNPMESGLEGHYARRSAQESLVCNWDKIDAEHMGLMKLDVLGLNALTILAQTRQLIKRRYGVDIDYDTLPLDDPKIYAEFNAGHGTGIFQFNSPGMMRICREIGIEDFEGVVTMNALHRPGPLRSGICNTYRKRKHGEEPVTYIHPFIEKITKSTKGLILYQEQVMRLMYDLGGLPWKTADAIRKVISKKKGEEQFLSFKQQFIDGCLNRKTVSAKEASEIFEELQYFGSYSFNRSHSCEYAMIACWEMWLRVYYPVDYMVTILTHGNPNKKAEHINEARRLSMSLSLPDINKSEARRWTADDKGNLLIPLSEVKGVGPTAAEAIVKARETSPFKNFDDFEERVNKSKVNVRVRKLLQEVMCFEPIESKINLNEDQLDNLSQYFDFNLSNDPMYKYRKMLRKLSTQIKIEPLSSVEFGSKVMDTCKYHFGIMDILKFGFKERGDGKTLRDVRGTAGDLGGVYGNFKDDSDYTMLVFSQKFYHKRKWEIEHCEDKWFLVYAKSASNYSNIWTDVMWFGDDLLEGKASGLDVQLLEEISYPAKFLNSDGLFLSACNDCALRKECRQVIYPSQGMFNAMIVGEAPGREEDAAGKVFVGDTGHILWTGKHGVRGLDFYGLKRQHFHVTNVCKCWPSTTGTPKSIHVKACRKYLDAEIKVIKPFIILSFGNTGLRYFKDQDKGIMDMSGRTEWNDEHNCWVCYCMHPASVLYHQENAEKVNAGIANFAEKMSILGFGN